jgi:nucleoside-diphosphate-sugar epimerase
MKRVLLTGASGFLGRQVVAPLLESGFEVHATSRAPLGMSSVREHNVDLFDESAVSKLLGTVRPTHLVHLAWYTKPPEYWQSSINEEWEAHSTHLFESFVASGGERLVGAGTCAEYEWGSDMLKEGTTAERPETPYGCAKLSLQRKAEELARKSAISFSWARLFFLFGPNEHEERFVSSIVDPLLRGEIAYCRNGNLVRDFLYVEDAGEAVVALAMSDVEGAVNVASGLGSQLGDVAREIGAVMRLPDLVHISAQSSVGTQPQSLVADVSRLRREVGWTPRYDRHDAIERTIAWRAVQKRMNAV